jgi:endonuclease-8
MHPFLARLGPDLLSDGLGWRDIAARLDDPRIPPDAPSRRCTSTRVFSPVTGNYLRSEVLFCAGIDPRRRPRDLSRQASADAWPARPSR